LKQLFVFRALFVYSARKTKTKQSGEDGAKRKKLLCGQFSFHSNFKGGREGGREVTNFHLYRRHEKEQQLLPRRATVDCNNKPATKKKKEDRQTDRSALQCTALQHSRLIKIVAPLYPSSSNGQIVVHRGNGQSRVFVAGNCLAVLGLTGLFSGGQTDTRSGRKLRAET